ncbi:MAG TPA: hypothetical protein DEF51_09510 [Myxococcales bacterium]|nr:hypothetical protein [Myxococcales bacterium]
MLSGPIAPARKASGWLTMASASSGGRRTVAPLQRSSMVPSPLAMRASRTSFAITMWTRVV